MPLLRFVLSLLLCALVTTSAAADDFEDFDRARQAYDAQDYDEAARLFEGLVVGEVPRVRNPTLLIEGRKYLGATYLFLDRPEDAARVFEAMVRQDPDYAIDSLAFPASVVRAFEEVQSRVRRELNAAEEEESRRRDEARRREEQRLAEQLVRVQRLEELASQETVEIQNNRFFATLPFGVGQFQNGHRSFGIALAISESLLLATSITTFAIHQNARAQLEQFNGTTTPVGFDEARWTDTERISRITNQISTFSLIGVALIGIVDAHIRYVPYHRETRSRSLPSDLQSDRRDNDRIRVGLGLGDLSVRVAF